MKAYNDDISDIFIVESGSDKDKLSKNYTWYAKQNSIKKKGLRFYRGMNYGLLKLYEEDKLNDYDAFFLITNDSVFERKPIIKKLLSYFDNDKKLGILSPCSKFWGEKKLIPKNGIKYFWFLYDNTILIRKKLLYKLMNKKNPNYYNFLFDGRNFRGYGLVSELISKAYKLNWASGITNSVWTEENETYLINYSDLIKTENYDDNLKLYFREGQRWMKKKYGFNNKWELNAFVKKNYDKFFKLNPNKKRFKI